MAAGDFAHNEKSITVATATNVSIVHTDTNNQATTLKSNIALLDGEIIDATVMSIKH